MDLNIVWFILIAVLYVGFFFLEGFDFGVGMLLPFLGKNDTERRSIMNTIGPHWDGNEVWLLTAGGATFAAFPHWYATMFSGFYLALFLILFALIVRGVSFEFRSKIAAPKWRSFWDWAVAVASFLAAFLLGVAFANLAKGVPIDAKMNYTGTFWTLLNPYGLIGGFSNAAGFLLIGAIFLSLKTSGELAERAHAAARRLWYPAVILIFALVGDHLLLHRHPGPFGCRSRSNSDRGFCGAAPDRIFYLPEPEWLGVCHDGHPPGPDAGLVLPDHVSARNDFHHQSGFQPDNLQRFLLRLTP